MEEVAAGRSRRYTGTSLWEFLVFPPSLLILIIICVGCVTLLERYLDDMEQRHRKSL